MTAVVDASVLIDSLRGLDVARRYLVGLSEPAVCSEVTRVEVLRGMRESELAATEKLLAAIEWVPVDEDIARRAGEIGRVWGRSHPGLSIADIVVAATAERLGARVATANVRHFPMFRGLKPPY